MSDLSPLYERVAMQRAKEQIETALMPKVIVEKITRELAEGKYNIDEVSDNPKVKKHIADALGKVIFALNHVERCPDFSKLTKLIDATVQYMTQYARQNNRTYRIVVALNQARTIFTNS